MVIDECEIMVCGIPALACDIRYTHGESPCYSEYCPSPGAPEEVEFTVCDRRGRPAPWLQRKLDADKAEDENVHCQVLDAVRNDIEESSYDFEDYCASPYAQRVASP